MKYNYLSGVGLLALVMVFGLACMTGAVVSQDSEKEDVIRVVLILGPEQETNIKDQWTVPHAPEFLLCTETIPPDENAFKVVCWKALFDGYMIERPDNDQVIRQMQ
jgi:hypothetical protein